MTELLEQAVRTARALSPEQQDELARLMIAYAIHDEPIYELTPEEEASLADARAEVGRGEFATDDEVRAIFAKHGL